MYSFASVFGKLDYLMPKKAKGGGSGMQVGFTVIVTISYRINGDRVTMTPYLGVMRDAVQRRVWDQVVSTLSGLWAKPAFGSSDKKIIVRVGRDDPSVMMMLIEERVGAVLNELGLQIRVVPKHHDFDAVVSGARIRRFITTMAHRMMMSRSVVPEQKGHLKKLHHVLGVDRGAAFCWLLYVAYEDDKNWSCLSTEFVFSDISLAEVASRHPKRYDKLLSALASVRRVKTSWKTSP